MHEIAEVQQGAELCKCINSRDEASSPTQAFYVFLIS